MEEPAERRFRHPFEESSASLLFKRASRKRNGSLREECFYMMRDERLTMTATHEGPVRRKSPMATQGARWENSVVTIRKAGHADIGKILKMYAQPAIDDGVVLSVEEAEVLFARILTYPNYSIYLAEVEKTAVGTIAVLIMDNLGHLGKPSAVFESFAVLPEWQRQGIGTAIMKYVMSLCQEAGCYKITLSADLKRNGAHDFYASLGFARHGYSYTLSLDQRR